jgi:Uma2 family endonuclease
MESVSDLAALPSTPEKIPPLRNGDRLTRAEFERRYEAMPLLKKAELIEGIVYMPSPVRHPEHGRPHFNVISWLGRYCDATPGMDGGDNSSLRLELDNEPQPDAFLMILPSHGGRAYIDEDGYVAVGPEFIVEVAASSVSYDLHAKRNAYQRSGVQEYLVWRVLDGAFDWLVLRGGEYEPLSPDARGIYRSEVLPGLWLDAPALIRGDRSAVVRTLEQGLASEAHAAFVSRLEQTASNHAG